LREEALRTNAMPPFLPTTPCRNTILAELKEKSAGACWLNMKTEGALQLRAMQWARIAWVPMVAGLVLISMATPWISATVRQRWFVLPELIALIAIPLMTGVASLAVRALLATRAVKGPLEWLPFVLLIGYSCSDSWAWPAASIRFS
jgi:cytochrome bd-type quinol oxidase subunit 2